jgi:HTH-type transcriptional regulator/antitoxin HipB
MEHVSRDEKQLGAVIRRCRKQSGHTQAQLGVIIGKRQATISDLESGMRGMSLDTVFSILNALDLEMVVRPRRKGDVNSFGDLF